MKKKLTQKSLNEKYQRKKSIESNVLKARYWVTMIDPKKKRLTQKLAI